MCNFPQAVAIPLPPFPNGVLPLSKVARLLISILLTDVLNKIRMNISVFHHCNTEDSNPRKNQCEGVKQTTKQTHKNLQKPHVTTPKLPFWLPAFCFSVWGSSFDGGGSGRNLVRTARCCSKTSGAKLIQKPRSEKQQQPANR